MVVLPTKPKSDALVIEKKKISLSKQA